jgi:hypothetical protein
MIDVIVKATRTDELVRNLSSPALHLNRVNPAL